MCRGRGDGGRGVDGSGPSGCGTLARLKEREGEREGEKEGGRDDRSEDWEISDRFEVSMNPVNCPLLIHAGP